MPVTLQCLDEKVKVDPRISHFVSGSVLLRIQDFGRTLGDYLNVDVFCSVLRWYPSE